MKGGQKKAHKTTKRKVHFATLMDIRHIQKYEYIPGNVRKSNLKCGNQFVFDELLHWNFLFLFFWRVFSYGTGTIINIMVGDRHQWKVARTNSKSSPCTSIITECSRLSQMNSEKLWIVNYGSALRKKEEDFDNVCFESSKPTVEYHR